MAQLSRGHLNSEQARAKRVFTYLHDEVFTRYEARQSSVVRTLEEGTYNCVSASILFNAMLDDMGIRTAAMEAPSHAYSVFWGGGKRVEVEPTNPRGFEPFRSAAEYRAVPRITRRTAEYRGVSRSTAEYRGVCGVCGGP